MLRKQEVRALGGRVLAKDRPPGTWVRDKTGWHIGKHQEQRACVPCQATPRGMTGPLKFHSTPCTHFPHLPATREHPTPQARSSRPPGKPLRKRCREKSSHTAAAETGRGSRGLPGLGRVRSGGLRCGQGAKAGGPWSRRKQEGGPLPAGPATGSRTVISPGRSFIPFSFLPFVYSFESTNLPSSRPCSISLLLPSLSSQVVNRTYHPEPQLPVERRKQITCWAHNRVSRPKEI